jgi:peroxiredoxin
MGNLRRRLLALAPLVVLGGGCERSTPHLAVEVGHPFPSFDLPDLVQRTHRLEDYRGIPLFLNFWATWCPPCREEMAGLKVLDRHLRSIAGTVIAISVDEDVNLVREFVLKAGIEFPVLLDKGRRFTEARLRMRSYPTSILLRPEGDVRMIVVGARDWGAQEQIDAVLAATRS